MIDFSRLILRRWPVLIVGLLLCLGCISCKTADRDVKPADPAVSAMESDTQLHKEANTALVASFKRVKKYRIIFTDRESNPSFKEGFYQIMGVLRSVDDRKAEAARKDLIKGDVRPAANYFKVVSTHMAKSNPHLAACYLRYSGSWRCSLTPSPGLKHYLRQFHCNRITTMPC